MERVITHFETTLADLELHIGTREGGINARKNYGHRLCNDIRQVKGQSKLIASKGYSTKHIDKVLKELTEEVKMNEAIVKNLKQNLAEMRHEAFCLTKAVEALKK